MTRGCASAGPASTSGRATRPSGIGCAFSDPLRARRPRPPQRQDLRETPPVQQMPSMRCARRTPARCR
eukprot:6574243-Lingulodinium_polyedra.AAC.1